MTKIAIIGVRGFPGIQGGVEMHCERIYPRVKGDVKFIVYRRKLYLTEKSNEKFDNIQFIDLPSTRIKGFEAVFHTLICCFHILFHRVNIVQIHNIGPGMFTPLLRLFGFKVVLTYHSANYEHKKWGTIAKMILRFSEFLSLNFASGIIFVNKFQRAKYSDKIKAKSVYIPNGIEKVSHSEHTDFIEKLGAKPKKYILGVGRLTPEKGFEYLVKAVQDIDEIDNLIIAGASDHDQTYFNLLKSLDIKNKVIFSGFTSGENLRQVYSHAKLFVLSSINEGFPLVMLEAMGYKLPMIVTDIPATHLIKLDTENYAKAGDSDDLRTKIRSALKKNEQDIEYNLDAYNWDNVAKQTIEVYKKILDKKK